MTAKTAPKAKKNVSMTPLLDQALGTNPHKPEWNKEVANALLAELNTVLVTVPTSDQAIVLLSQYGPLAGWKESAKAVVKASRAR